MQESSPWSLRFWSNAPPCTELLSPHESWSIRWGDRAPGFGTKILGLVSRCLWKPSTYHNWRWLPKRFQKAGAQSPWSFWSGKFWRWLAVYTFTTHTCLARHQSWSRLKVACYVHMLSHAPEQQNGQIIVYFHNWNLPWTTFPVR